MKPDRSFSKDASGIIPVHLSGSEILAMHFERRKLGTLGSDYRMM